MRAFPVSTSLCSAAALLLLSLAACSEPTTAQPRPDVPPAGGDSATAIATEPLKASPIRIAVDDLPEPYASASADKHPNVIDMPDDAVLQAPDSFRVQIYADDVPEARWMTLTPEGDVLLAQSKENQIRRLRDTTGDGIADVREVFATSENGLDQPFGMAFVGGHFYVANTGAVLRFPYERGQKALQGQGEVITELTPGGYNQHWTRNLAVAPDSQHLFVSVGSDSNVGREEPPRASILVMNLDGTGRRTYASGLRNPVGMALHPETGQLYATVNERDKLGNDLVPDYLTHVEEDAFYGWPYAYLTPQNLDPRRMDEGRSERPELAAQTVTPDVLFQAHSAALGLQFYDKDQFPETYQGDAFVAFRGSWNRDRGTGYKIVHLPFDADGRPEGGYEDFLTGFLTNPVGPDTWARPVGLLVLPDGSLLLAEDGHGRVFRISYDGGA